METERLKELYAQALQDIQAKEEQAKCESLEKTCDTICTKGGQIRKECELEFCRALELDCSKWEACEAQLEAQLRAAK